MILEKIIWFFNKILELIEKYGLKKIWQTIFICIVSLIGISIFNKCQTSEIIKEYIEKQYVTHENQNEKRVEIDPEVRQYLLKTINQLNCNRAYILEMHNGVSNPSGLPFRYCEMTYEEINYKSDEVSDQYDKINMSRYPIFTYLNENGIFIGSINDLAKLDNKMANRMRVNNVKYLALKILNGHQKPLAVLGVSYCNDSIKSEHQKLLMISAIAKYGDKISLLLDMNREEIKYN